MRLLVLLAVLASPLTAWAGDCVASFDGNPAPPAWTGLPLYSGTTAVQDALNNGCVDIGLYCSDVKGRCASDPFVIAGLSGVTLTSLELDGTGGAVQVLGKGWTVAVLNSKDVAIYGLDLVQSDDSHALKVQDSQNVLISGLPTITDPRYSVFRAPFGEAFSIEGASVVYTNLVAAVDSLVGFGISHQSQVFSKGIVIRNNQRPAVLDSSYPVTCSSSSVLYWSIATDEGPTWLNYIVGNDRAALIGGASRVEIEHAVIAGNARCPHSICSHRDGSVFVVNDASVLRIQNAAIYDNDEDAGIDVPNAGTGTSGITNGHVVFFSTCGEVDISSSTIFSNASEDTFRWEAPNIGSFGPFVLDHTLISTGGFKVLSHSTAACTSPIWPTCSVDSNNIVLEDPAVCGNGAHILTDDSVIVYWEEAKGAQALKAMGLPLFPLAVPPYHPLLTDSTSLVDPVHQDGWYCDATEVATKIFRETADWSVNPGGTNDVYPLDVGFHNVYPH